ncbi:MAG: hypothetical protein ACREDD_03200 [Methylocella sp.]
MDPVGVHFRRGNQGGQDAAHPVDEIAPDFAAVVVFDEALNPLWRMLRILVPSMCTV